MEYTETEPPFGGMRFCPECVDYNASRIRRRADTFRIGDTKITLDAIVPMCSACGAFVGTGRDAKETIDAIIAVVGPGNLLAELRCDLF